jgi:hypothetical protein
MTTLPHSYSVENSGTPRLSRAAALFTRLPLTMVALIFTLIGIKYLINPVHAASAAGITFTSPGGITVARVGFAAFPLSFAVLALSCLVSARRVLAGLYMVLTVMAMVIAVRVVGMVLDHSAETARLLAPEGVLVTLAVLGIRLEIGRRRRKDCPRPEPNTREQAPSFPLKRL